ncbi:MAG: acylneuraminate cytidylyltransferase family protein [Pseudomonadota bacterium]
MSADGRQQAPVVTAFIFARGGSKGVPGKNIRPLAGRPLIAWAIQAALASRYVDRVVVSTDDPEIAQVAVRHGAEAPFLRPAELAGDTASELLAWQHALRTIAALPGHPAPDVFLSVPTTAPLREPDDLDRCVEGLLAGPFDLCLTATPAARSPFFNQIVLGPEGRARLVIEPQGGEVIRRQDAPAVYDLTTVAYAARPQYVLATQALMSGRVTAVMVPPERALDIDTLLDFEIAEFLMQRRLAGEGKP